MTDSVGTRPAGQTLTVVVPAYNEAPALLATLSALVEHLQRRGWRLIVVDDGSNDATPEVLDAYAGTPGVTVIRHKVRRGYGGAIKTGIRAAETDLVITVDADGQHRPDDIDALYEVSQRTDADMVVGDRGPRSSGAIREIGKRIIRLLTKLLVRLPIRDLNSGMKLYRTTLARRYVHVCPDTMAYSDVIALAFLHARHLVVEHPITVRPRTGGTSTITAATAFDTVLEILNIITLFNPMRIFLPLSLVSIAAGVVWGANRLLILRAGLSVGALLAITTGVLFFVLGLLAEQLSALLRARQD